MTPIRGTPLCHWVVRSLNQAGFSDLTIILNSSGQAVRESLEKGFPSLAWRFIHRDTASSWESFRWVAKALARRSRAFLVSTVDALIAPRQIRRFARQMTQLRPSAGLALTDWVDDEKPLWADLNEHGRVCALGPRAKARKAVTAGLYYLSADVAARLPSAGAYGSLRHFWMELVENGIPVAGLLLPMAVDVDRPTDVALAEAAVASW